MFIVQKYGKGLIKQTRLILHQQKLKTYDRVLVRQVQPTKSPVYLLGPVYGLDVDIQRSYVFNQFSIFKEFNL